MRNSRFFLLVCVIFTATASASFHNDEKYYDRMVAKQIANWLAQTVQNKDSPTLQTVTATKRNSEIINSILGLPQNLNDVGKK